MPPARCATRWRSRPGRSGCPLRHGNGGQWRRQRPHRVAARVDASNCAATVTGQRRARGPAGDLRWALRNEGRKADPCSAACGSARSAATGVPGHFHRRRNRAPSTCRRWSMVFGADPTASAVSRWGPPPGQLGARLGLPAAVDARLGKHRGVRAPCCRWWLRSCPTVPESGTGEDSDRLHALFPEVTSRELGVPYARRGAWRWKSTSGRKPDGPQREPGRREPKGRSVLACPPPARSNTLGRDGRLQPTPVEDRPHSLQLFSGKPGLSQLRLNQ
jgi:hypothetical protein